RRGRVGSRCAQTGSDDAEADDHRFCREENERLRGWRRSQAAIVNQAGDYFTTAGTGITYLPSFSATKFSVELVELQLMSFVSMLIFNFFVGVSGSLALLPSGPVCTSDAFFTSSGVRSTSSILVILAVPAPSVCIIL